jgi:hypothetical protein
VTERDGGNGTGFGRGTERPDGEVEAPRQNGQVGREQHRRLHGESAQRAVVIAVARRRVRTALAVGLDAKRGGVAEGRFQLGRDHSHVGGG